MKHRLAALVFTVMVIATPVYASPTEQNVLDDIPLMQGLQSDEDKDLLRIFPDSGTSNEAIATGAVAVDDVDAYYKHTLPDLGWEALGASDYKRGNEKLHINAQTDGNETTVTLTKKNSVP